MLTAGGFFGLSSSCPLLSRGVIYLTVVPDSLTMGSSFSSSAKFMVAAFSKFLLFGFFSLALSFLMLSLSVCSFEFCALAGDTDLKVDSGGSGGLNLRKVGSSKKTENYSLIDFCGFFCCLLRASLTFWSSATASFSWSIFLKSFWMSWIPLGVTLSSSLSY